MADVPGKFETALAALETTLAAVSGLTVVRAPYEVDPEELAESGDWPAASTAQLVHLFDALSIVEANPEGRTRGQPGSSAGQQRHQTGRCLIRVWCAASANDSTTYHTVRRTVLNALEDKMNATDTWGSDGYTWDWEQVEPISDLQPYPGMAIVLRIDIWE